MVKAESLLLLEYWREAGVEVSRRSKVMMIFMICMVFMIFMVFMVFMVILVTLVIMRG